MRKLILFVLILSALAAGGAAESETGYGNLRVRFFKIGKADAFLLRTLNHAVLIDAGESDDGPEIVEYLQDKGIDTLDCLVLTHFDKRSIGGVPEVLEAVSVKRVLMPDYEKDSDLALMVFGLLESQPVEKVKSNVDFRLDQVDFSVLPARETMYSEDEDNNFSLVVSVRHGQNSLFFSGDIMSQRIAEMADAGLLTPRTLVKMPCHGQNIQGLGQLLDSLKPEIAILTASAKNPPAGALISDLDARGIRWYCTMDGSITLTSDGHGMSLVQTRKAKP